MRALRRSLLSLLAFLGLLFPVPDVTGQGGVPTGEAKPSLSAQWAALSDAGKHEAARTLADRAVAAHPGNAQPWYLRGVSHCDLKEWDRAIVDLTEAIRLGCDDHNVYLWRGVAYQSNNNWAASIVDFTKCLDANPKAVIARLYRGISHHNMDAVEKARKDYDQVISEDPKRASAYAYRGMLAQYDERAPDKAVADYRRAVELRPNNPEDRRVLAWLLATCADEKVRDGSAAIEAAQKACELTGFKDGKHLDALAAALAEGGQFVAAVDFATKASDLSPPADRPPIQFRLELYKLGKPYRE